MKRESMKIGIICHGNIARSQVLHHYLQKYADRASVDLDLFSCGTAPVEAYSDVECLLKDVQDELDKRGLNACVKRDILENNDAQEFIKRSDVVLVADMDRKEEVLGQCR